MATGQRTSRRNRVFGPCPEVPLEVTQIGITDGINAKDRTSIKSGVSKEVKALEASRSFYEEEQSNDGDIYRREFSLSSDDDDDEKLRKKNGDNIAEELDMLLAMSLNDGHQLQTQKMLPSQRRDIDNKNSNSCFCDDVPHYDEVDGLPVNWTKQSSVDKQYTLVTLRRGNPEFNVIEKEFRKAEIKVKKIERLENKRSLDRFKSEAEDITRHRTGDFSLNVRYLYHGTNVKKEILCEEGLDQRLSRKGYFGNGIYFSDNPLKCAHYSEDLQQQGSYEASILKCRVILGDTKVYQGGQNDIDLKREPEKETASHGSKYYDSVLGCPKDLNEFVVYENRRAMIEYIITFQADVSVIKNLRQLTKDAPKDKLQGEDDSEERYRMLVDVREAVQRKRLGNSYVSPSNMQQQKDKLRWKKIQKLQVVKCEQEKNKEKLEKQYKRQSSFEDLQDPISELDLLEMPSSYASGTGQYETGHDTRQTVVTEQSPHVYERYSPVIMWENEPEKQEEQDWFPSSSSTGDNYQTRGDNPEDQVLSLCIAEFLSFTGLEDSSLAKHFVLKSEMDVNHAISMYYEEC